MLIKVSKLFLLLLLVISVVSCDKDDPEIPDEEEVITTLTYVLTPATGGASVTMSFQDLDGDGGNEPIISGGTLAASTTYNCTLELLNEAESPAEDITEEIEEEDEEHQFFFETSFSDLSFAYGDQDENGNPVGLMSTVTTGAVGSGTIKITLKHEPEKTASGVAQGDITNSGGEIDIEVTFPVDVQ